MKIINKINDCIESKQPFYSFEFFPPKTQAGVENLYSRMDRMAALEPLFCDITFGAGGTTSERTLDISANAQKYCGLEMMMHLTCTNLPVDELRKALDGAKDAGIQNILALRGDPPRNIDVTPYSGQDTAFSHAIDLVRFIKREYGDYFCIAVAGHPETHIDAPDLETDIAHLKEKVDAGADFIITQLFYDASRFLVFLQKCREIGITCPIVPGIMPIQTYGGFTRMTAFCKTCVPDHVRERLERVKDDDEKVKECGIELGIELCQQLMEHGVPGLHFYTLNLERSVRKILTGLELTKNSACRREFPWRPSAQAKRAAESVRPIFWANRPKSYLHRTSSWDTDEFSNGRWGDDNRSPAFGELDPHYAPFSRISIEDRKAMWGESVGSHIDVYEVFARYVSGLVSKLPWCEVPLHLETKSIQDKLVAINRGGFLTINSQPRVNAANSDDPLFGWGGAGGKVYQKAYVECFVSPRNLKQLMENCNAMGSVQYHAVDVRGNSYSNRVKGTTAVTWGVFPHREILQPTVVDTDSFMAWKDEAFSLWLSMWASVYNDESESSAVLHEIHDTYFLVSVVDNNFISGDIWKIFERTHQDIGDVSSER